MFFLELVVIALGMLVSFYLQNIQFLMVSNVYPDFLLTFLIYFALRRGEFSGIWIGFFAGMLEDAAPFGYAQDANIYVIGNHMLFYTITGFILGKLNRIIDRDSMVPVVMVVFITAILVRCCIWLLYGVIMDFN